MNVARNDLYEDGIADVLEELLTHYQLDPSLLHLEVLERTYVKDTATIYRTLSRLRELGFYIEMDDFGTGESSLSMLAEMPVDLLKLDRSFLVSALRDKRRVEVIRCIIGLARALAIDVIAEGVESQEQADLLLSVGCTHAQGYFYCRPQPAAFFMDLP